MRASHIVQQYSLGSSMLEYLHSPRHSHCFNKKISVGSSSDQVGSGYGRMCCIHQLDGKQTSEGKTDRTLRYPSAPKLNGGDGPSIQDIQIEVVVTIPSWMRRLFHPGAGERPFWTCNWRSHDGRWECFFLPLQLLRTLLVSLWDPLLPLHAPLSEYGFKLAVAFISRGSTPAYQIESW